MNVLSNYLTQILWAIFLAVAGFLGMQAKNLYKKYVTTEIKQAVCKTAVRFVEQVYKDIHGPEKLDAAMKRASEMLAEYGIVISEYELVSLFEAAVNEFNNIFSKNTAYGQPIIPSYCEPINSLTQEDEKHYNIGDGIPDRDEVDG